MSPPTGSSPSPPHYDPALFVNREKEIALVVEKAQKLSLGEPVRNRTVFFKGNKGTGRTWLLQHLTKQALPELDGVKAQYLNLEDWKERDPDEAVGEILTRINQQVNTRLGNSATQPGVSADASSTLSDRSNQLQKNIETLLNQHTFVLALDHIYESDWKLLELLEEYVLAGLAVKPYVLLVMAGRGHEYVWKKPELRLHVEDHHLNRFQEDHTKKQIEKQRPKAISRTTEIYKASRGYPLVTFYLADYPTVAAGLQDTLNGLLVGIEPEERLWLEGLSILRAFDEERIPLVLSTYLHDRSIQSWPYKQIRATRDRLLQTQMARWSEEAGGWVMDQAIRPLLEQYIQQTQPDMWHRLHCQVYQFYQTWGQDYPEEAIRWQEEADYHARNLRQAKHDPDQCLEQ